MATPFSVQGVLNLPGAPGLSADPLPFGISSQFDSKAECEYLLPALAGTKSVDFGTMPVAGAKVVLLSYEALPDVAADPLEVTLNGGSAPVEVSAGGFLCIGSPSPATGITSLSIDYTSAGKVFIWLLG